MRGRILFVAGLAVGYVVGARAGRPAYEAVVERVHGIAGSDTVQHAGAKAKQVLEETAPGVAGAAEQVAATATAAASAAAEAGAPVDADAQQPGAPAASGSAD